MEFVERTILGCGTFELSLVSLMPCLLLIFLCCSKKPTKTKESFSTKKPSDKENSLPEKDKKPKTPPPKNKSPKNSPTLKEKDNSPKNSPTLKEKDDSPKNSPTLKEKDKSPKNSPTLKEKVKKPQTLEKKAMEETPGAEEEKDGEANSAETFSGANYTATVHGAPGRRLPEKGYERTVEKRETVVVQAGRHAKVIQDLADQLELLKPLPSKKYSDDIPKTKTPKTQSSTEKTQSGQGSPLNEQGKSPPKIGSQTVGTVSTQQSSLPLPNLTNPKNRNQLKDK